jgi:hypothetical protein
VRFTEDTMKDVVMISIAVPRPLHRQARHSAIEAEMTLKRFILSAVERAVTTRDGATTPPTKRTRATSRGPKPEAAPAPTPPSQADPPERTYSDVREKG